MRLSAARNLWQLRRLLGLVLAVIVAFVVYIAILEHNARRPHTGESRGSTAVGVLILHHRLICTASIVNSPAGNLVITAAHCLDGKLEPNLMFVPDYAHKRAPFGEWRVTGQVFPSGWFPYGNINEDFAFLTVRGDVEARAGAERLGYSTPTPSRVWLEGYSPAGTLMVCSRRPGTITAAGQQQLSFACPGYTSASSGGPFLTGVRGRSGLGTIVGVIGGYQQGGDTPSLSYSSPFSAVVHRMYGAVTHAGTASGG
jgi:hypothetical protein